MDDPPGAAHENPDPADDPPGAAHEGCGETGATGVVHTTESGCADENVCRASPSGRITPHSWQNRSPSGAGVWQLGHNLEFVTLVLSFDAGPDAPLAAFSTHQPLVKGPCENDVTELSRLAGSSRPR